MFLNAMFNTIFRIGFIFYGKQNKIFSKKIAAIARKKASTSQPVGVLNLGGIEHS
jgi:hypothetical protein